MNNIAQRKMPASLALVTGTTLLAAVASSQAKPPVSFCVEIPLSASQATLGDDLATVKL